MTVWLLILLTLAAVAFIVFALSHTALANQWMMMGVGNTLDSVALTPCGALQADHTDACNAVLVPLLGV